MKLKTFRQRKKAEIFIKEYKKSPKWKDNHDNTECMVINEYEVEDIPLEQKPKSEWEQDHEILKAYSDGMNEVLDKLRAEIETKYGQCDICEYFEDYDYEENCISEYRPIGDIADILEIIDRYKVETEG